jgi:GGDEF domain-containing protein
MFTIAGFDVIERKHGVKMGVEVLGQFALRLRNAFHTPEFLCRWGQAQFLLLSPDDLVRLTTRATNLAHLLSTPYSTASGVSITLRCQYSVVERRRDETGEQLIARLENA